MRGSRMYLVAALLAVAGVGLACDLRHPVAQPRLKLAAGASDYWIGPGVSGSWFDPARSGEGIILQVLPDGRAFAIWFTFPATGETDPAAWLLATDGVRDGNTLRFAEVLQPRGARFGEAFDPDDVDYARWGGLVLRFEHCGAMTASWEGPAGYGSGSRAMQRLSVVDQIDCGGQRLLNESGSRAAEGLRSRSGAWFVSDRPGEGWLVEDLADGQSLVYWFSFDGEGRQAWLVGQGQRAGSRIEVEQMLLGGGTRFGDDFDPDAVSLTPWGSFTLEYDHCEGGRVRYASTLPGFGSAERPIQRLTRLGGAPCIDPSTASPAGAWQERRTSPLPAQSEHAVTANEGLLYALGGFGAPRAFRRYDPSGDVWSVLPDLPAGRDHLSAFALDGAIYMAGGAPLGGGNQDTPAFRYRLATGSWEPVPALASSFGSHSTVLGGYAYVGDASGRLQQFDPMGDRVRIIDAPDFTPRDHSQVVAFLDEIWVIAGRSPENTAVRIYDPVSERWRVGPPIRHPRGGFAAAAGDRTLVLTGGEVIGGALYNEPRSEWIRAGEASWSSAPEYPVAVHGTAGAVVDGRFIVVSGSTRPGEIAGASGRTFALDLGED
ncbi:Kelch repeat-containing protein [Pseudomarimonas salicorniae]|uniref:N-acetylneuraminate epimerase n=1 Tax=Pseudomarimonas salicorniae TaxID=2933270 RepID=A0ABT0GGD7_9GAMM|nr:kelch motif-containing protein [Lysobacter sp. CAU 1642]MCK7593604.1 hypothetical protein [Lysobacter sp. CAU 1642]